MSFPKVPVSKAPLSPEAPIFAASAAGIGREAWGRGVKMVKRKIASAALVLAFLAGCSGVGEPNDAIGAKVLRNMFARAKVPANIVSFKKTMGRAAKAGSNEVYEYWYESEIQFPKGYDAKCADEKERGACALLGILHDQSFKDNETLRSEGALQFIKSEKGWSAEDGNAY